MRQRARIDDNQPQIVTALRAAGADVQSLAAVGKGVPDLLVAYGNANHLLEVKVGVPPVSVTRFAPNGASLVSTIPPPLSPREEWASGEGRKLNTDNNQENLQERLNASSALFSAVQKEIREQVQAVLGYDQFCSGSHAVRRLVQRFEEIEAAGRRILAEPFGCPFCDSGKLRKPDDPAKNHLPDCGFAMMARALPVRTTPYHKDDDVPDYVDVPESQVSNETASLRSARHPA